MSRASILLSQKIAPALRFAGAAFALALALSTPARANLYAFDFHGWYGSAEYVEAAGHIESAGIGVGPVSFLGGTVVTYTYVPNDNSGSQSQCFIRPNSCHLMSGRPQPVTISSAMWVPFSGGSSELVLTTGGGTALGSNPGDGLGDRQLHLTEVMAVPGPIAGTGLPVLAGLLAAWGFLRRRSRAE